MIEINGMAHVILTVSSFDECTQFYSELLPFFGMKKVFDGDDFCYHVGGRTAIGIQRCQSQFAGERFEQGRVGLHHICLRARNREDIDATHQKVLELGGTVVHPPESGGWAPDYYSVLFEDPDGIRLEINYVPGKGVFAEGATFSSAGTYS
jgi:catechol 2,3-dioxygenase-like lactoylglutathione lyase family enzyme